MPFDSLLNRLSSLFKPPRLQLTLIIVSLALILGILSMKYWGISPLHYFALHSVHDEVTQIVKGWANMSQLPGDDLALEVIWSKSGGHFEFFPSAAQDLTAKLDSKFKDSKTPVIAYTDFNGVANPGGKVKTVGQLADAVRLNYRPKE